MTRWYVIRTRDEFGARDRLADVGFYAHVPTECVNRRRGRKVQPLERPVWRGYAFVLCERADLDRVIDASGAFDAVRYHKTIEIASEMFAIAAPVSLPLNALDEIMAAEVAGDLDYTPGYKLTQRGDRVRVSSGKWKGYLGRVISVAKRKAILELETGFGKLTVDPDILEEAPEQAKAA